MFTFFLFFSIEFVFKANNNLDLSILTIKFKYSNRKIRMGIKDFSVCKTDLKIAKSKRIKKKKNNIYVLISNCLNDIYN
jgi:hypothetical protein